MKHVLYGKCVKCGKTYDAVPDLTNCECGGILDIVYDYDYIKTQLTREKLAARQDHTMWRYRELLPVEPETPSTPLRVGWSPLYEEPRLADVMDGLMTLPESRKSISPPALYVGATDDYAGKPVVLFSHEAAEYPEIALELFEAGVGTLVLPYASEAVVAAVKEQNIGNLAVMGHVTADSIGINAFLSYLEGQGAEVIRMSGVINVREEA